MSEEVPNDRPRIPRPGSFVTDSEPSPDHDFDTAALLLNIQEELDHQELSITTLGGELHFEGERKSIESLRDQGPLDEWRSRAVWFEQEAEVCPDPALKARLLLLASEHYAALDESKRARAVAARASAVDDDFAARQLRQLAYQEGDLEAVRGALNLETEAARTVDERAHAAFYLAELERVRLDSMTQAVHYLDLGQRIQEGDPRAALFKLARQLGQSGRPPTVKWPDAKELESLRFASAVLGRLRGDRTKLSAEEAREPLLAFFEAQQALGRGKSAEAGQALKGLFLEPDLGTAARWLSASLLGPDPATRHEAVVALSELLDIAPSAALRRTLAARSLEAGRPEAARKALFEDDGDGEPAFGDIERIALGALLAAPESRLAAWLKEAQQSPTTRTFAWAMTRALGGQPRFAASESAKTAARLELATMLETSEWSRVEERLPALKAELADDALLDLLAVELAYRGGRSAEVAEAIISWTRNLEAEDRARGQFAAGLLLERSKRPSEALPAYRAALASSAFGETAYRALSTLDRNAASTAERLQLVDALRGNEQREALLTEIALSLLDPEVGDRGVREMALARLLQLDPYSPVASLLDERRLLLQNDREALRKRLEAQLPSTKGAFHSALLRVRLCALDADPEVKKGWLKEALAAWPKDAALVFDYERGSQPSAVEIAKLRERLGRAARTPWSKGRLLLEAALYYEAGGAHSEASSCAKESDVLVGSELAKQCYTRNALHTDVEIAKRRDDCLWCCNE